MLQGSPILLGNSLVAGMNAFLAEPAKAHTPAAFALGVLTGADLTLIMHVAIGL